MTKLPDKRVAQLLIDGESILPDDADEDNREEGGMVSCI
jgi:hypothetical protein